MWRNAWERPCVKPMLSLSTYLGHARITDTYWYLTGVPELMALAGAKFMQFMEMEVDDA